jgi:hypothetical protein
MGAKHFEYIKSFLVSAILGVKRFSDAELLRLDKPIRTMFGCKKGMPDQSILSRFFSQIRHTSFNRLNNRSKNNSLARSIQIHQLMGFVFSDFPVIYSFLFRMLKDSKH